MQAVTYGTPNGAPAGAGTGELQPVRLGDRDRSASRFVARAIRHPIVTTWIVALLLRVLLIAGLSVTAAHSMFLDDATYSKLAKENAAETTQRWTRAERDLYRSTATFLVPLTVLYRIIGHEHTTVARLYVALLGSTAAAMTCCLALFFMSRRWALLAGVIVATLPSQVLFSSLVLKDAAVWAVLVLLAVASVIASRSDGRRLIGSIVLAGVVLLLLSGLREHTLVVAAWAFFAASVVGVSKQRTAHVAGALILLLAIPLAVGIGPGGVDLIRENRGKLAAARLRYASGADTAIVHRSDGSGDFDSFGIGLRTLVVDPVPWSSSGSGRVQEARLESALFWWPLLVLAIAGLGVSWRQLRALAFPLILMGGIIMMYSLSEGNFGTAYRHRGEFVWVVAVLAAFGAQSVHAFARRWRALADGEVACEHS